MNINQVIWNIKLALLKNKFALSKLIEHDSKCFSLGPYKWYLKDTGKGSFRLDLDEDPLVELSEAFFIFHSHQDIEYFVEKVTDVDFEVPKGYVDLY